METWEILSWVPHGIAVIGILLKKWPVVALAFVSLFIVPVPMDVESQLYGLSKTDWMISISADAGVLVLGFIMRQWLGFAFGILCLLTTVFGFSMFGV